MEGLHCVTEGLDLSEHLETEREWFHPAWARGQNSGTIWSAVLLKVSQIKVKKHRAKVPGTYSREDGASPHQASLSSGPHPTQDAQERAGGVTRQTWSPTRVRMQAIAPTVARGCTVRAFLEEDSEEAQVHIRVS